MPLENEELEAIDEVNTVIQSNALRLTSGRLEQIAALNPMHARPQGQLLASEWVLVVNWIDQTDVSLWSMHCPPTVLETHAKGLLYAALHPI